MVTVDRLVGRAGGARVSVVPAAVVVGVAEVGPGVDVGDGKIELESVAVGWTVTVNVETNSPA